MQCRQSAYLVLYNSWNSVLLRVDVHNCDSESTLIFPFLDLSILISPPLQWFISLPIILNLFNTAYPDKPFFIKVTSLVMIDFFQ